MSAPAVARDLLETCQAETAGLLADFDLAPTPAGLMDVGAVAEIVVLGDTVPGSDGLLHQLCDSAAGWLRRGILEELCVSRVDLTYHAALLAFLAQRGRGCCDAEMTPLKRLCEARLIGRGEMPILLQKLTAAYLTRCGIDADFGDLGQRDPARMIDKRVLRARSDEFDILAIILCAQLAHLDPRSALSGPTLFPRTLLVQAIRSGNLNWVPVLTFLCMHLSALDDGLRAAAFAHLRQSLPAPGKLLPAPTVAGIDSDYIGRAQRGLRLRSTVALAFCLRTDPHPHDAQ